MGVRAGGRREGLPWRSRRLRSRMMATEMVNPVSMSAAITPSIPTPKPAMSPTSTIASATAASVTRRRRARARAAA